MNAQLIQAPDKDILQDYTQTPKILLYGLPEVSIQDKWALIALMGRCWGKNKPLAELEGPYRLTLREIAGITGIDHTALRSREGKSPRKGVLDRWQEYGYLTIEDETPKNEETGKEGKKRMYLTIHLRRIWEDNQQFINPAPLRTSPTSLKLVDHVNISNSKDVDTVTKVVDVVTVPVDVVNKDVDGACSEVTPIKTNKDFLKTNNTREHISSVKNNGSPERQPPQFGFIKMAMRECMSFCGEDRDNTRILTQIHSILEQSGIQRDDFRLKIDKVVNRIKGSDTRDIEAFIRLLEKACPVKQQIAREG